jgi:hypothetical protein
VAAADMRIWLSVDRRPRAEEDQRRDRPKPGKDPATKLCYTLKYSGLTKPLAAHIHKGTATQNGSIVVDLKPKFANGKAATCVPIKSSVASAIRKSPSGYYANVHTQKNPDGAIRGQLSAS